MHAPAGWATPSHLQSALLELRALLTPLLACAHAVLLTHLCAPTMNARLPHADATPRAKPFLTASQVLPSPPALELSLECSTCPLRLRAAELLSASASATLPGRFRPGRLPFEPLLLSERAPKPPGLPAWALFCTLPPRRCFDAPLLPLHAHVCYYPTCNVAVDGWASMTGQPAKGGKHCCAGRMLAGQAGASGGAQRARRVAIGSCAPDLQAVVRLAWGHPSHKATQGATTLLAAMACCFSAAADAPPQTPPPRRYRDRTPQEVGCPQAPPPPPPRSTAAGAHRTAPKPHVCPTAAYAQVEELRQRLSAIMPPLEVDMLQQDATVNATRLPSTEAPQGASPFGASFAFQRRHSMRGQQAAAAAAAGQQSKQQSPQPDEQLHGDSRSASGESSPLWIVDDGCC